MNSRYRERKYNTSDNDRLLRALSQPVQAWDKKWTQHSDAKNLQTFKWMKSERVIEFEEDEDDEVEADVGGSQKDQHEEFSSIAKPLNENTLPGGSSSFLTNKVVSSVQQQDDDDDDEQRSQTPKLDDISDFEDPNANNEDDNDTDSINDPSKHPALAPHAQAHMTDDEMTDSTAATPQTTTESNTPIPLLEDESMDETNNDSNHHIPAGPHPLSQEILAGTTTFMNTDDAQPLNNDSPIIQTSEDNTIHQQVDVMEE
ncbi:MAG: hypothetical protein EXX96DRAFT_484898 [Benjaminiella poitrasii]|nr:MAG: hypothetical protein EXX96DRAFT_484898 [Benjaminiella poitrasii]